MRKLGKRPKQIFAFVATPCYDGRVYTDYTLSLADTVAFCAHADRMGITEAPIKTHCGIMGNGAFIELARNTFVQMFLETTCTHLFFVDADLKWEPRVFAGMLTANKPICAGAYRRRQEPENYPVMLEPNPEGGSIWSVDGGWINCRRVPGGFLCIRRDVVEEMVKAAPVMKQPDSKEWPTLPWVFATKFDETGKYVGEDFTFCDSYIEKYKEMIPVWPDADFVHGGFKCNFMEYLNRVAEQDIFKKREVPTNTGMMAVKESEIFKEPKLAVVK